MSGKFYSTFAERRKWLESHPELLNATRNVIIAAMKKAGLISPSTYSLDVRIYQEKGPDLPNVAQVRW